MPYPLNCVVFDFAGTLSSDQYFKVAPPDFPPWRPTGVSSWRPTGVSSWRNLFQCRVFDDADLFDAWMCGDVTAGDIAQIIARDVDLDPTTIQAIMAEGCRHLSFNAAVLDFVLTCRAQGRRTALVTANIDLFTTIVVPAHGLHAHFDVIVNSADHHTTDKVRLWPLAFEALGPEVNYRTSLLIEDNVTNVDRFRRLAGTAHPYRNDTTFRTWLARHPL